MRLPIRARITAAFAVVMLGLLVAIGVLAYVSMSTALLDEIDSGLRFRAASVAQGGPVSGVALPDPRLEEPTEAFEQILTRAGRIERTSQGFGTPLLDAKELARIHAPTFFERPVRNVVGDARLLAVPLESTGGADVLVVGTTMADRTDALRRLVGVLLVGEPAAVALACLAGWVVGGWALSPVERMRQQAAAITASGLDHRLTVKPTRDELERLARTLNDMLDRLAQSMTSERAFLERASHELRTPLAALRAEVDLALRRRRSVGELTAALHSVSQETDRLARLAADLLVLARAENGRLPLHCENVSLRATLDSAAALFAARALELGIDLTVEAPDSVVSADPLRLRQALVNLVDNALRHTPRHGAVQLAATVDQASAHIVVSDTGSGFDPSDEPDGPGLGLRIVWAVAASHGGTVHIERSVSGGARVELVLPRRGEGVRPTPNGMRG